MKYRTIELTEKSGDIWQHVLYARVLTKELPKGGLHVLLSNLDTITSAEFSWDEPVEDPWEDEE